MDIINNHLYTSSVQHGSPTLEKRTIQQIRAKHKESNTLDKKEGIYHCRGCKKRIRYKYDLMSMHNFGAMCRKCYFDFLDKSP